MIRVRRRKKLFFVSFVASVIFCLYQLGQLLQQWNVRPQWESLRGRNFQDLVAPNVDTILTRPNLSFLPNATAAVVFVCSRPKSVEMRNSVRKTWAQGSLAMGVAVLFFVGDVRDGLTTQLKVAKEGRELGDIVADSMDDTYYHLPVKVLRMMKFYLEVYGERLEKGDRVPMFVKTDVDVFVNVGNFLEGLKAEGVDDDEDWIAGKKFYGRDTTVQRVVQSKGYIPLKVYPWLWYPPYVTGAFYAMPGRTVAKIFEAAMAHTYFPFEDVFISGLVANQQLHLRLVNLPHIQVDFHKNFKRSQVPSAIAIHKITSPQMMNETWFTQIQNQTVE